MARAHQIDPKLAFEQLRVPLLRALRHRVAHIGKALVPVQAANLHAFSVEKEPIRRKARLAKANAAGVCVGFLIRTGEFDREVVNIRFVQVPKSHVSGGKRNRDFLPLFAAERDGLLIYAHFTLCAGEREFEFCLSARSAQIVQIRVQIDAPAVLRLHGFCLRGMNIDFFRLLKPNLAVDAAVGQVVDHVAKRRNIVSLGGVHHHGQHILPASDEAGEFAGKRRISAEVLG